MRAGMPPLHLGAQKANVSIVQYLLEREADADIQNDNEETPLHWAILNVKDDEKLRQIVELIISADTDTKLTNKSGSTALHLTAVKARTGIAQILLAKKADPNILNIYQTSPCYRLLWTSEMRLS